MADELPICCVCGESIDGNVKYTPEGRAHHPACKPDLAAEKKASRSAQSLGEFAERKARNVLHGKGQQQLEDDRG